MNTNFKQTAIGGNAYLHLFKKKQVLAILAIAAISVAGCKKSQKTGDDDTTESYYGYGKLTVECESKCHVSYGTPGKMNEYDVEANKATYYFRYQTKYDLDINVTPTDVKQTMTLNVFSREEKQIYSNSIRRDVNDTWNNLILVP